MNNIQTIILASLTNHITFIAYTDECDERKFKIKSSDQNVDKKEVPKQLILDFICEYIDQKLLFKKNKYGISVKKIENTAIILFDQMDITKSFYNEEDNFYVFPKPILNKTNFISIKHFYGDKLNIARYHVRTSAENWSTYKDQVICNKDMRYKLYKLILESILINDYKVKLNCNISSEIMLDIQTKADYQEEE